MKCLYEAVIIKNRNDDYSKEYIIASSFFEAQNWAKKNISNLYDVVWIAGGFQPTNLHFVEDSNKPAPQG